MNHTMAASIAVLAFRYSVLTRRVEQAHSDIVQAENRIGELRREARQAEEEAGEVFQQMRAIYAPALGAIA